MSKYLALICFFALINFSCKNSTWYVSSQLLSNEGWFDSDTLIFDFNTIDTTSINAITLEVEFDQLLFGYQNLYVNIQTIFPNLETTNQIVSLEILGDESLITKKCSKDICRVPILLMNNFRYSNIGKHSIKISQHSREKNIKGIKKLILSIDSM